MLLTKYPVLIEVRRDSIIRSRWNAWEGKKRIVTGALTKTECETLAEYSVRRCHPQGIFTLVKN